MSLTSPEPAAPAMGPFKARRPHGKPCAEEIVPTGIGIRYSPPALVIAFMEGEAEDASKASHTIRLSETTLAQDTQQVVDALKAHSRHGPFVHRIPDHQLASLFERLKTALGQRRREQDKENTENSCPNKEASNAPSSPKTRSRSVAGRRVKSSPPKVLLRRTAPEGLGLGLLRPALQDRTAQVDFLPSPALSSKSSVKAPEVLEDEWPAGAWTAWSLKDLAQPNEKIGDVFESFRTSRSIDDVATSFAALLRTATAMQQSAAPLAGALPELTETNPLPMTVIRTAVGSQRRLAQVLWERLDARLAAADYGAQSSGVRPLSGRRAVVVGAGPVGLRAALELKLLGAEVVVLERRVSTERINRLHLWPWCGQDLKNWGAKVLEPPELSFGADPDFLHVGISELQLLLLKPCLLLGIQVFFGAEFQASSPGAVGWDILVGSACGAPGPRPPGRLCNVSVLVGADGPRSTVAKNHGFDMQETASLRREAALGLVVNFANRQTPADKGRRPFSLARQFYEPLFRACEQETGLSLENIVCYISSLTYYFVMTPVRRSLIDSGIVAADCPDGSSLLSTLNEVKLAAAAKAVAAFAWRPDDPPLSEETLAAPVGNPALFDFSRTRRAATGLRVLEGPPNATSGRPSRMLVGLCGDALIEPFWPEGLGIVRGFFAALDLASSAKVWVESGEDASAAEGHFEAAFRQLKSVAAKTRVQVLRPEESSYGLDPATRYRFAGATGSGNGRSRASSVPAVRISR